MRSLMISLLLLSAGCCSAQTNTYFYAGAPVSSNVSVTLTNRGYVVGYSNIKEDPLWVCYRLFRRNSDGNEARPSRFKTDKRTEAKVTHDDYTGTGYDRGHMAPNAAIAHCYGRDAQLETFLMSNVVPQKPDLNRGPWKKLEATVLGWTAHMEQLWVMTGPIFDGYTEMLPCDVEIPDACFKVIVDETNGVPRVLAFIMPRDVERKSPPEAYLVTVDEIERATGLDLLPGLPETLEEGLESRKTGALWACP